MSHRTTTSLNTQTENIATLIATLYANVLEVVTSAIQASFLDETGFAVLIQEHVTLAAAQTLSMPLQVWGDVKGELVLDRLFAAVTDSAILICPFNCT